MVVPTLIKYLWVCSVLTVFIYYKCEGKSNCGVLINSMCSDDVTSKWNKENIESNLKIWIKSVKKLFAVKRKDLIYFKFRKKVLANQQSGILKYIGNMDCSNKTIVGPIWQTGGTTSKNQFHDGFFYGTSDGKGELTGTLNRSTNNAI